MIDQILELRSIFEKLDKDVQMKEAKRMMRIAMDIRPIIVTPIDGTDSQFIFNTIPEVVTYLKNAGHTNAEGSYVGKVLNGHRKSAYGHKIEYGSI